MYSECMHEKIMHMFFSQILYQDAGEVPFQLSSWTASLELQHPFPK